MKQTESEKFHELLKGFDTAVLVTHAGEGRLRARPMVVAPVDDNYLYRAVKAVLTHTNLKSRKAGSMDT